MTEQLANGGAFQEAGADDIPEDSRSGRTQDPQAYDLVGRGFGGMSPAMKTVVAVVMGEEPPENLEGTRWELVDGEVVHCP